jgi:hypothetical protein
MKNSTMPSQEPNKEPGAHSAPQSSHEQMVDAHALLLLLWDEASRPSLRWLREQTARRTIPFIKVGSRVWFLASDVERCLQEKWTVKRR